MRILWAETIRETQIEILKLKKQNTRIEKSLQEFSRNCSKKTKRLGELKCKVF